ncbi:YfiR family protein [Methylomonas sp. SURF-2]|uniref:YfiR family protein n=1 Tax=Methylomonas subterranea TaxID=2952225 RepID=A0ABT1TFQ2_9GAMM|nr:YfiR family protein [Methylomonas sp. SURF-2]MCQ8104086.1 YfiR family protein [Methylomonas sp. SURF-2]
MFRVFLQTLLVCYWLCAVSVCHAEDDQTVNREYQLKTAYLFHFAELAEWPEATHVVICLQGNHPIRSYLPVLNGQHINNKAVLVKFDIPIAIAECQILFFSDLDALSNTVLEQAQKFHVLLVSDVENFAQTGGMIQFTLRDNKLKLVVNLSAVKLAGLKLSSKLLRMAEILE